MFLVESLDPSKSVLRSIEQKLCAMRIHASMSLDVMALILILDAAALNAKLNGVKKPEARELLAMNGSRKSGDIDVEASEKGKEALLPATFSTSVTVEQMDSLTRRLQPPRRLQFLY